MCSPPPKEQTSLLFLFFHRLWVIAWFGPPLAALGLVVLSMICASAVKGYVWLGGFHSWSPCGSGPHSSLWEAGFFLVAPLYFFFGQLPWDPPGPPTTWWLLCFLCNGVLVLVSIGRLLTARGHGTLLLCTMTIIQAELDHISVCDFGQSQPSLWISCDLSHPCCAVCGWGCGRDTCTTPLSASCLSLRGLGGEGTKQGVPVASVLCRRGGEGSWEQLPPWGRGLRM